MCLGKEFRMHVLVPALKEFSLPRLKKTSTHGEKRTFLILNLLIQLPPAASSGKGFIRIDRLHFSLEGDDLEGREEPQGLLMLKVVQSNAKASLFDRVKFTRSCFMMRRSVQPSVSTGITHLGTLKSSATDIEHKRYWRNICPWGTEFQTWKTTRRSERSCAFFFSQLLLAKKFSKFAFSQIGVPPSEESAFQVHSFFDRAQSLWTAAVKFTPKERFPLARPVGAVIS